MFGNLLQGLVKGAGDIYNKYIGNPSGQFVDKQIARVANPVQGAVNNIAKPFTYNQTLPVNPLVQAQNLPPSTPSPVRTPVPPQPTQIPQQQFGQQLTKQALLNGINKWTASNSQPVPITQNIDSFVQAGNDFQARGLDPYMPTIMSLRETQGGRDNGNPAYQGKIGNNNVFNIRNIAGGQPGNSKAFVNYPDVPTSVVGGNGQGGFEGQVLNSGIYGDYLKSRALEDFFAHYSPPQDGNGDIPTQIQNYQYMRRFFQ